jgi:pimeloyl-ACP methyl ester carboxylesterase
MVGLDTHVEDVIRVIDVLGLQDVVLVGHSYAGQVITAVADRRPDVVAKRVYLDAFVGEDGENAVSLQPESVAHHWSESAAGPGFGWLVPVRKLEVLGVTEQADIDWLTPRLTPHPWKTYTDPLRLSGAVERVPAAFIECVDWMRAFRSQADRARAEGWPVFDLATGHEAMVTASKELAGVLDTLVG